MPSEETELTAALAEYQALRSEILSIRQVKRNILGIALAAYAAIFSVTLGADGDPALLLVVPPLGLVLCVFELSETIQIARIGTYIREQVWPEVQRITDYRHSWETRHDGQGPAGKAGLALLLDGALPITLCGASVLALQRMDEVPLFAVICAVLTIAAPASYGMYFVVRYRAGRRTDATTP